MDGIVNYTFSIPYINRKNYTLIRIMSDKFGSGIDIYKIM